MILGIYVSDKIIIEFPCFTLVLHLSKFMWSNRLRAAADKIKDVLIAGGSHKEQVDSMQECTIDRSNLDCISEEAFYF